MMGQRYYSPDLCRFIQPDDIEYLDPSSINGLNLYCYCMNNPIMYSDPSGHSPEWLKTGIVIGASVLSVALIALTCGAATPILVGAVTGGISSAAFSILGQDAFNNGKINWNTVIVDAYVGMALGAIGASNIGRTGLALSNFSVESIGSLANDFVNGHDVNVENLVWTMFFSGISSTLGYASKSDGAQNKISLGSIKNAKNVLKNTVKGTLEFENAKLYLSKVSKKVYSRAYKNIVKDIPENMITNFIFMGV